MITININEVCAVKKSHLVKYEDARRVIKCTQKIYGLSCKQTDYVENHQFLTS